MVTSLTVAAADGTATETTQLRTLTGKDHLLQPDAVAKLALGVSESQKSRDTLLAREIAGEAGVPVPEQAGAYATLAQPGGVPPPPSQHGGAMPRNESGTQPSATGALALPSQTNASPPSVSADGCPIGIQGLKTNVPRTERAAQQHNARDAETFENKKAAASPIESSKLTADDLRFANVTEYVLNRVTDFCSDRAVLRNGTWQTQIPMDPKIMPDCVLHLTLSGYELTLRFETSDAVSQALISKHGGILRNRLAALLAERGASREIVITS